MKVILLVQENVPFTELTFRSRAVWGPVGATADAALGRVLGLVRFYYLLFWGLHMEHSTVSQLVTTGALSVEGK